MRLFRSLPYRRMRKNPSSSPGNSNRVVRIVDTNATAVITTIALAGSTNVVFRGIDFTPEARAGTALRAEK